MSYAKLHTSAIVLGSYDAGEASRVFALFTERLGLVYARSQGVRELKSRHRYALQTLSLADVSLIRGSNSWRVTNASPRTPLYTTDSSVRIALLVRRLVRGEQRDEVLFDIVSKGLHFLSTTECSESDVARAEVLIVLRMLHRLGYLKASPEFEPLLADGSDFAHRLLSIIRPLRPSAIRAINEALKASQL